MTMVSPDTKDNPETVQVVVTGCWWGPGRASLLRLVHKTCPAQDGISSAIITSVRTQERPILEQGMSWSTTHETTAECFLKLLISSWVRRHIMRSCPLFLSRLPLSSSAERALRQGRQGMAYNLSSTSFLRLARVIHLRKCPVFPHLKQ